MSTSFLSFTVELSQVTITTAAETSDKAVDLVLEAEKAPFEAFKAVWQDNPTPPLNARYGAPMGRMSRPLDPDGTFKADEVALDEGYDAGGAYWGCRFAPNRLFWVQDGMGNVAFVDAISPDDAIAQLT